MPDVAWRRALGSAGQSEILAVIAVRTLRELPVSAASGLVVIGNTFYVIADDALHLGIFKLDDPGFAQSLRLRDGELPVDKKARKKLKPDFEALVALPPQAEYPHGALLALGSGSKANRQQAVLVPLSANEEAVAAVVAVDLAPLYASLALDDCNIEGAIVHGEQLVLLQRGNNKHEKSALVVVPLSELFPCAAGGVPAARGNHPAQIIPVSLPGIDGVPLGFTDAVCLPNGNILFAAVAEDTDDSYSDGACLGAAIGEMTLQGELLRCEWLAEPHKIEGIALAGDAQHVYAVTDADDPAVPAILLAIQREDGDAVL